MISQPVVSQSFFGREEELALLQSCVERAKRGTGACVLIRGERGSGKTRLVDELRSGGLGVEVEVLHCHRGNGASSLADALKRARSRKAVAIVIEDADCADTGLFDAVASSYDERALLWIVTFSPPPEPSEELELALARLRMRGAYEITMRPLDDLAMRRIVASFRVRGARLGRQRVSHVVQLSGGNPGLATEITRTFLSTPMLDAAPVPDAILARARSGLERLADGDRDIVSIAALIGATFSLEDLCAVSALSENDVARALQRGAASGLLRESARGMFAFVHPLLHEAVRLQCMPTWASPYHHRIAENLAKERDDLVAAEESARHYAASGATERAADESDRVANAHLAQNAFLLAARNFRRAAKLHGEDRKRKDALKNLGSALSRGGFDDEALPVYQELLDHARASLKVEEEAAILMDVMQLVYGRGEIEKANELGRRVLAMDLPAQHPLRHAVTVKLAAFAASSARFDKVLELLAQLEDYQPLDLSARAHIAQLRGFALSATDSFEAALPLLHESVELIERTGNASDVVKFTRNFGTLAVSHGETDLALPLLGRAFEHSFGTHTESLIEATAGAYADALVRCGKIIEARDVLDRVDVRTSDFGGIKDYFIVPMMLEVGSMLDDRELVTRALEVEQPLIEGALRSRESQRIASAFAIFAAHHWSAGNPDRAQWLLAEALKSVHSVAWNQRFCILVARCGREDDIPTARSLLLADTSVAGRVLDGYLALFDAFAARRSGKARVAERFGRAAAERFADVGWPLLQAQALDAAGDHVAALGLYERVRDVRDADVLRDAMRPRGGARAHAVGLTEREHGIASLAAQGLSNKEIAARLSVGVRTVEFHLQSVYGKLSIKSRWQIPLDLSSAP